MINHRHTALSALVLLLTTSALVGIAHAGGGLGGGAGTGRLGGTGYSGTAGGDANDPSWVHAGGGGGGAGGGLGGIGAPGTGGQFGGAGGSGGNGGLNNQNGAAPGDGSVGAVGGSSGPGGVAGGGGSGGGGGAGGAGFYYLFNITDLLNQANTATIIGGKGGAGGKGFSNGGAGGGGGDGGGGVVMGDGFNVTANVGSITGGVGGRGGDGANTGPPATPGTGGIGGAGIIAAAGGNITIAPGTMVTGGTGGAGGNSGSTGGGPMNPLSSGGDGGVGGAGVNIAGVGSLVVRAGASVIGGNGGAAGLGSVANGQAGAGGSGIRVSGGTGVIVAGTVSGGMDGTNAVRANAIDLIGGGNSLTLENGYSVTGDVVSDGAGAGDSLALGGGSNGSFDLGLIGTTFANFGSFGKSGSSVWTLTGSSAFTGPTTVSAGTLVVDGSLAASALTINSGAILRGIGTVGATTANSGGTIAPGSGVGTLNINGNLIFATGSTYALDVAPGSSDRVAVTGNAALNGTVVVNSASSANLFPATPSEFTILSTTGIVTGTFASLDTSALAFFSGRLDYATANQVKLTLTRNAVSIPDVAAPGNEKNAAQAIESLGSDNPLYTAILGLSTPQAQSAYQQVSGESLGSAAGAQVQSSNLVSTSAIDRVNQTFDALADVEANGYMPALFSTEANSRSFWISGYGARSNVAAGSQNAASATDTGGVSFGLDGKINDWTVGLMGGYGVSASTVAAMGTKIGSADYSAGVYAGTEWGSVRLALGAVYTYSSVNSTRTITLPSAQTLTADFAAGTGTIFGEVANKFDLGALNLTPYVGAQYVRAMGAAYSETGGSAALSVAARQNDVFYTMIGLRPSVDFVVGGDMLLTLGAGTGWKHAFADQPTITHSFVAGGNSFAVSSAPLPADRLSLEASASLDVSAALVLDLGYTGEIAANAQTHQVQAGVKGSF